MHERRELKLIWAFCVLKFNYYQWAQGEDEDPIVLRAQKERKANDLRNQDAEPDEQLRDTANGTTEIGRRDFSEVRWAQSGIKA